MEADFTLHFHLFGRLRSALPEMNSFFFALPPCSVISSTVPPVEIVDQTILRGRFHLAQPCADIYLLKQIGRALKNVCVMSVADEKRKFSSEFSQFLFLVAVYK